jgi:hypothetical protein
VCVCVCVCLWQSEVFEYVKVIYSPTDAQGNCLKNSIKIYIKIAPTYFGVVTLSSGSSLSVLATYAATSPPIQSHTDVP